MATLAPQPSTGFLSTAQARGALLNSVVAPQPNQLGPFKVGWTFAGKATILSGATTVVVTFANPEPDANYIVIATELTKGTTAAYIVGISSQTAAHFTITCSTNPGVGGLACSYVIVRTA